MQQTLTLPLSLTKGGALPISRLTERRRQQRHFFRLFPC
jgi:hypothetical protein